MKRKIDDQDFENIPEVKPCKFPLTVINNSANYLSPTRGAIPQGPRMDSVGVADSELRRVMDNFVNIYEQLGKCNGPNMKPNYSYTELAYLAMLRSPNFCLPITEIYRYIQSRFAFFKNSTRKHWKNAVRHSLAKTLCFTKIPVGRGTSTSENLSRSTYLWCIIPSSIASFARGDYRPSADRESGTNTLRWGFYRVNAGKFWDQVSTFLSARMVAFKNVLESSHDPGQILESQVCCIPQSTQLQQDAKPFTSSPVVNNSSTDVQTFNAVAMTSFGTSGLPMVSTPPNCQRQLQRGAAYRTTMTSPKYELPIPKYEILTPDTSLSDSSKRTPAYNSYCFDSGNESIGCESSPEERRILSSCRQQQHTTSSPVLDLTAAHYLPKEHDLSDIDITPFEVPELTDFSYIVSPNSEFASPHQKHPFNDSGYAIDYSFSSKVESSPFVNNNSSCQYTYTMESPVSHPPRNAPDFNIVQKSHPEERRIGAASNFDNYFITNSDPMFSNFTAPNWNV